jgi:hypothetical protein
MRPSPSRKQWHTVDVPGRLHGASYPAAPATMYSTTLEPTLAVEPCEDHLCTWVGSVGWLHGPHVSVCFSSHKKSLKLHRRSLEMKFCFSMTHPYTSSSGAAGHCRTLPGISQPIPLKPPPPRGRPSKLLTPM